MFYQNFGHDNLVIYYNKNKLNKGKLVELVRTKNPLFSSRNMTLRMYFGEPINKRTKLINLVD